MISPSFLLSLLSVQGIGAKRCWRLLNAFGSPEAAWQAPLNALNDYLPAEVAQNIHRARQNAAHAAKVERDITWCAANDISIVTYLDEAYPDLLKEIHVPPPCLYIKGNAALLRHPQLAVVGSRSASHSGRRVTQKLVNDLVQTGLVMTSGLALGIDSEAHAACLSAGGKTIAVLGTGVDVVYPKRNVKLAQHIVDQGGALVSEFPLGTAPSAQHFPQRNRIISGLSLGTLVIEASLRSGSLITARCALEQNREVFAVPGAPSSPTSRGCHALIKQGAALVENAEDIINELPNVELSVAKHPIEAETETSASLSNEERQVLAQLDYSPTSLDTLSVRVGLPVADLLCALGGLELQGKVAQEAQGYVVL